MRSNLASQTWLRIPSLRIQQKEPVGLQGLSDGELQAADGQSAVAGHQQVSGVYQEG